MNNDEKTPIPEITGSDGLQRKEEGKQVFLKSPPFTNNEFTHAVEGIAASNSRAFGGEVGSMMFKASMRQMSYDKEILQDENKRLNKKVDLLQEKIKEVEIENATISQKLISLRDHKHLRNLVVSAGMALVGIGLTLAQQKIDSYVLAAIVFGTLFTIFDWFYGGEGDKKGLPLMTFSNFQS